MTTLLEVKGLGVRFRTEFGLVQAVNDVSFKVSRGETLAVVGESGCGKSVTALALMRLLDRTATIHGEALFEGSDLFALSEKEMQGIRGARIGMIFQDPMTALNPVFTVGDQIAEVVLIHRDCTKQEAKTRAIEMMDLVGIPDSKRRVDQYPHEFSGGMRQRAMIAMAIANSPSLLIADEPTTALDVTVQAQVMEVIRSVQESIGLTVMLITHDLGLVAGFADRIQVMYAGQLVETSDRDRIFYETRNPYTRALLDSIPSQLGVPGTELKTIGGNPPSLLSPPPGCPFQPRCAHAKDACRLSRPQLEAVGPDHLSRCLRSAELGILK
jgi:oligopeptide/dipeptide ABC transporter ATP-binding protein